MRLSTRVVALCVGLFASHHAMAAELPQRWVSAGGALSEWVCELGANRNWSESTPPASTHHLSRRYRASAINGSCRRKVS